MNEGAIVRSPPIARSDAAILSIGLFKLLKGLLLLFVGVGAVALLHHDVADTALEVVDALRVDPDNRYIHAALERILNVTPKQLREISAGTFIYAGLLLTEGVGLLMRQHWAEYFTVITTGGLIPLEIWELAKRVTVIRIAVLIINVAIVVYLIWRIQDRSKTAGEATSDTVRNDRSAR